MKAPICKNCGWFNEGTAWGHDGLCIIRNVAVLQDYACPIYVEDEEKPKENKD